MFAMTTTATPTTLGGIEIPFAEPESFLRAAVEAGLIRLEVEE